MKRHLLSAIALAGMVSMAALTTVPARADNLLNRITVNVTPIFDFSSAGDDNQPVPAGYTGIGHTTDHPTVNIDRVNYGINFNLAKGLNLGYSHTNIGYQLGQITSLAPKTSLVTGSIVDHSDTISLSQGIGTTGLTVHAQYVSHQRESVTGLCLNQKSCPNPVTGQQQSNGQSIDEIYYNFGGTYNFGPKTIIGKPFTLAGDLKYVPRSATNSFDPALGGLGAYKGTQVLVPYSFTSYVPILHDATVIPFVNYTVLPVLYHDSAVPEDYRGIVFGLVKVINKNLTFSYTNLNLQSCRCVARVPPPDNLRLTLGIVALDIHTGL